MIIKDEEKCPCCSGKLFKYCCKPYIGSSHEDYEAALENYEYINAYNIEIARLTDYLTKIYAHTIPLLNDENPIGVFLFELDIKAVEEFMENIFYVLGNKKIEDNLEKRFWAISKVIQNERWESLFQFYTILYCNLFEKQNKNQYINEIEISTKTDKRLLQVIFSALDYQHGIGKKLEIGSLIIQKSDSKFEQLQYQFSIAIEYYIANDKESSKKYADQVIAELENYDIEEANICEVIKIAEIYEFYAGIFDRREYYSKAMELYAKCEKSGMLNNSGYSMVYNSMAYLYLKQQMFDTAIEYFNKGFEFEKNNFSLIHLAETYLYTKIPEKAEEYLKCIEYGSLGTDVVDYYIVKAKLYIFVDNKEEIKRLISEMKNIDLSRIPLFNDIFNGLINELQKKRDAERSFIDKMQNICKYLILQPNIGGIGIDVGKILDDLDKE